MWLKALPWNPADLDVLGHPLPGEVTLGNTHTSLSLSSLLYKAGMRTLSPSDRAVVNQSRTVYAKCLTHSQCLITVVIIIQGE